MRGIGLSSILGEFKALPIVSRSISVHNHDMALYFEITTGEQIGQRYSIQTGMSIGRKSADLPLKDSKVSGRHATVVMGPDGSLFLVDEGSSNGIKYEGQKVRELEMLNGVEFQVGRTKIRVVEMDPADAGEIIVEEPKTWQQIVSALAMRGIDQSRPPKKEIAGFFPPIKMKFTQGVQSGTEWTIGYGPREIGAASHDLILDEPGLSGNCFRLIPHADGPLLKSELGVGIKLNGAPVENAFLSDGDELDIHATRIKIRIEK